MPRRRSPINLTRDGLAIDVLVNNAGFGALGPVAELDVERQMEMIQVNVAALTHLTRLLLPGMIERRRGGILNVGLDRRLPGRALHGRLLCHQGLRDLLQRGPGR